VASLGETFVTKSYVKGQKMIKKSNAKSTVSPSRRGEGSRAKPVAKRVSPSKRGEGSTNTKGIVAMKKKTAKIQESAVTNLPITVAKGLIALGKKGKMQPREPKPHTMGGMLYRVHGETAAKQKAIIRNQKKKYKNSNQIAKQAVKEGQLPRGFTSNSVSSKQTKVPIKKIGKR
jgi:hypothetical protein